MIKVGAVQLDISHPITFAKVMKDIGRGSYTSVFNNGFRTDEYVSKFMTENNVAVRYNNLEEMADNVDIAFIHSCNWDKHLDMAMPFIKKGKPVFIDKPIVGSLKHCLEIEKLASKGAKILGSSSFRYCDEFAGFLSKPVDERGEIVSLFGSTGVDEFNYGIHAIEAIGAFLPSGAASVQCLSRGKVEQYKVRYNSGLEVLYQLGNGVWRPTMLIVTTTKLSVHFEPVTGNLYKSILIRIFDFVENGTSMAHIDHLTESIKIALAAKASKEHNCAEINLKDLSISDSGYDGNAFEAYYAKLNTK